MTMALKFLSEAFLKILNMSITASWVILITILLRLLLRKAPKAIVCFLWLFVAIRLICPFSVESVFSLIPVSEPISLGTIYSTEATVNAGQSNIGNTVSVPISPMQLVQVIFPILWAIGMVVLLIFALISYLRLRKKVGMTVPYRDHIFLCDTIPSPFILGIFFPKIYLPSDLTENQIFYALAHEQAHLSRKDYLWKPLGYLLLVVHWFNPLCWIGYMLLCRDIEFACDEKAIRSLLFEEKRAYSQALLDCSVSRHTTIACPLAFGEVDVKARVKNVLHYKKPALWVVGGAAIVCAITAVCLLTNPRSIETPAQMPISGNSEWGILILPTEGKRIRALQVDLEKYRDAQTEEEQDKVLQELLNNPNNKIVEMTPTGEPSRGGTTEAVFEGE